MPQPIIMELTRPGRILTARRGPQKKIYRPEEGNLKIIPLGGLEEVGRNLTAFEFVSKAGKSEILILDVGLGFPYLEEMPGIDFVIPNIEYLSQNRQNIIGILVTHGHYDHIGAIPYVLDQLGNPPIYTTPLTRGLILKRQEDFHGSPKPEIIEFKKEESKTLKIGSFLVDYFHVNHNIPDSVGFFLRTPVGNIMHTGDFKIDFTPVFDKPADLSRVVELAGQGTRLLMIDSTNAPEPGHVISERKIMENLEEVIKHAPGRVIAATFASLLERVQHLVFLASTFNRKIVVEGHSMRLNVEVARRLGYLQYARGVFARPEEATKLPPQQVIIVCTGAQAEDSSVLTRIANREHRYFDIIPGDTVIFSSSIIPGNERAVQNLKDVLTKQGANIVHYQMMDIHASGHAFADDIRLFINLVRPEYLMPVHGQFYMMKASEKIALDLGIPQEKIILMQNGQILEMTPERIVATEKRVPANLVFVDGIGIGDIGEVVLRDRQTLSKDGMFVVIVTLNSQTGSIRTSPDIISRGFVYLRESKDLLKDVRDLIRRIIDRNVRFLGEEAPIIQEEQIKYHLKEEIAEFLFRKTQRRPIVLPVVIKV